MVVDARRMVVLTRIEAAAIAALLWCIADEFEDNHDRAVGATGAAALTESRIGIPGFPHNAIAARHSLSFYQCVRRSLLVELEQRDGVSNQDDRGFSYATEVEVLDPDFIAELLWAVATDENARNPALTAYFACFLEQKITDQGCGGTDLSHYREVIRFFDEKVASLNELSEGERPEPS